MEALKAELEDFVSGCDEANLMSEICKYEKISAMGSRMVTSVINPDKPLDSQSAFPLHIGYEQCNLSNYEEVVKKHKIAVFARLHNNIHAESVFHRAKDDVQDKIRRNYTISLAGIIKKRNGVLIKRATQLIVYRAIVKMVVETSGFDLNLVSTKDTSWQNNSNLEKAFIGLRSKMSKTTFKKHAKELLDYSFKNFTLIGDVLDKEFETKVSRN